MEWQRWVKGQWMPLDDLILFYWPRSKSKDLFNNCKPTSKTNWNKTLNNKMRILLIILNEGNFDAQFWNPIQRLSFYFIFLHFFLFFNSFSSIGIITNFDKIWKDYKFLELREKEILQHQLALISSRKAKQILIWM